MRRVSSSFSQPSLLSFQGQQPFNYFSDLLKSLFALHIQSVTLRLFSNILTQLGVRAQKSPNILCHITRCLWSVLCPKRQLNISDALNFKSREKEEFLEGSNFEGDIFPGRQKINVLVLFHLTLKFMHNIVTLPLSPFQTPWNESTFW